MAFTLKKYYANTPCTFVGTGDIVYIPDDVEVTELEPTTGAIMMALNDKGSLLPPGYTRIAFLESTKGPYIDTGWREPLLLKMKYACVYSDRLASSISGGGGGWGLYSWEYGSPWAVYGTTTDTEITLPCFSIFPPSSVRCLPLEFGKIYEVEHDQYDKPGNTWNIVKIGNARIGCNSGYTDATFHNATYFRNYRLFDSEACERVWYAKIFRSGQLMRDYIPAVAPNGELCMYETITKQTLYNVGTGKFVAGIETPDQLAQLSNNLPVATPVYNSSGVQTGPTITLSLSSAFANSEYLSIAMDRIASKNWIVAIHEWIGGAYE